MKEIPLIAWILIGGLGFIILSSYLSLLSMLRNKNKKPGQFSWINSWRALSRPFEKENQQLSELSEQVSKFKPNNTVDENGTDQSSQSLS